jgi:hypothetical protein
VDTTDSIASAHDPRPEVRAGDPFAHAREPEGTSEASECPACFAGYVTITVEEDGQEHDEPVPCRRCALDDAASVF